MACLVQINPAVQFPHDETLLEAHRAHYPFIGPKTTTFTILKCTTSEKVKVQDMGQFAEMVYTVFIDQEMDNGIYKKNALALKNNVSKMELNVDGQVVVHAYKPDFAHKNYTREYTGEIR